MSDFITLVEEYSQKDHAKVHGVIAKCVNGEGKTIYSKIAGYDSIAPDAAPLREDAVFKYASATKLMTSIALLQCVDKELIGLDEPLTKVVPELGTELLKSDGESGITVEPTQKTITARHLLSHTSGLAYWFLNPLLMKWKKRAEGQKFANSTRVDEKCNNPLVFEPGEGWEYGVSLDWAGVIVRRLHEGMSLEDYMIENIWKKVGRSAPFPTFCISRDQEYKDRLMGGAERAADGSLKPYEFWQGDNANDQDGGHGLSGTADDWLAVLADLVSDSPQLLKPETVALMFEPQIQRDSTSMKMLLQLRPAWEIVAGPVPDSAVNHGLGGLLVTEEVPSICQPKGILAWGGAANTIWFASKDHGVAGFFSTQLHPFGDPMAKNLVNAWKKDFWSQCVAVKELGV
ncbi:beta-lactamase/transpeptidase-like protein [Microthyrium microscopicum]|uniref:Beta-lactamase/transpeptidase-like protein n=1 Tax=Microthyrium microscopicum TaxID=703497 RepID=A0A6A6U9R3_9PEZI|nr:beta-lactamase/transpeptidase-like protein [Microthyrium microscopicum]